MAGKKPVRISIRVDEAFYDRIALQIERNKECLIGPTSITSLIIYSVENYFKEAEELYNYMESSGNYSGHYRLPGE